MADVFRFPVSFIFIYFVVQQELGFIVLNEQKRYRVKIKQVERFIFMQTAIYKVIQFYSVEDDDELVYTLKKIIVNNSLYFLMFLTR